MIGLYDPYLYNAPRGAFLVPNLELMKLYNYYTKQQKEFCKLILPSEREFEAYDSIYCFSEFPVEVPEHIKKLTNVIYGGPGFSNGIYISFENTAIDLTMPNIGVYKPFLQNTHWSVKQINNFLDNTYYRMYAGDNALPLPNAKSSQRFYIYDTNLLNKDWEKTLYVINKLNTTAIYTIHPVLCNSLEDLCKLFRLSSFSKQNLIILNLTYKDIIKNLKYYTDILLGDVTLSSKIFLSLNCNKLTNIERYNFICCQLNLLYYFWSKGIPVKCLYQDIDSRFPLRQLCIKISKWSLLDSVSKQNQSILQYITRKDKQEYELLIKFIPEAKNLFIQTWYGLNIKKYWR